MVPVSKCADSLCSSITSELSFMSFAGAVQRKPKLRMNSTDVNMDLTYAAFFTDAQRHMNKKVCIAEHDYALSALMSDCSGE